jgi:hypothetical protein
MRQIKKTGNKGAAKWELKITDKQSNTYSVYSSKKMHLIEYIKKHL